MISKQFNLFFSSKMNVIDIQRERGKKILRKVLWGQMHIVLILMQTTIHFIYILYLLKVVVAVVVEVSFLPTFHAIDFGFCLKQCLFCSRCLIKY